MAFPNRVIKKDEKDKVVVRSVQQQLNKLGCGPIDDDGKFGSGTENAVKLFQSRFTDSDGLPLKIDGQVGPITWRALFGESSVPAVSDVEDPLLAKALEVADSQIGVMEKPPGSNRGPEVDKYLRLVGLDPAAGSFPWCAAFVYFCFDQASQELDETNPVVKTASVLDHWNKAGRQGITRILQSEAVSNPALVTPGQIFILSTGGGSGHTGLIESVNGGKLVTIEGNTNVGGSREGIGVFRREMRKIGDINKGFIDYSNA